MTTMLENSGKLREAWYAAALSSELGKKPVGRVLFEEMIVLWRRENGRVGALVDRCPHRNALLSEGTVVGGCVRCPYHGWTFDADGDCVQIPSESEDGSTQRQRRADAFPTLERYGLVWVWMGVGDPEGEPFEMPFWDAEGWRSYYMKTPFDNDVTNLVENFMDVPHTVFVHRGWFRDRKSMPVAVTVERREGSVYVLYDQPHDSVGASTLLLNPKRLPMVHTDQFFMPNNTRVDYIFGEDERGFVITSTCSPISEDRTMVYTLISYKLGWFGKIAQLFLPWYTRQVIQQDVEIMEIQRRALNHYGEEKFSSTPADTIHLYIESLRDWAKKNPNEPQPKPARRELTFWI